MFLKEEREELKSRIRGHFQFLTEPELEQIDELVVTQKRKRGHFDGHCRMCGAEGVRVRNMDIYVIGSEGLNACHDCEMLIVNYVRTIKNLCESSHMNGYKAGKRNHVEAVEQ